MITIYAQSFMTATRTGGIRQKDTAVTSPATGRRRWFAWAHRWFSDGCV